MEIKIKFVKDYKYFKKGTEYNLNNFTILTGQNGSGKTNLIQAIAYCKDEELTINGFPKNKLTTKYFGHSYFTSSPNHESYPITNYRDNHINKSWLDFQDYQAGHKEKLDDNSNIKRIADHYNIPVNNLTHEHFQRYPTSRENEKIELFGYKFFEDSAIYLARLEQNKYNHFRNKEYNEQNLFLTVDDQRKRFGIPPWEIINEIFSSVGSKYRFTYPLKVRRDGQLRVVLVDQENNIELFLKDLSEGEKTILSMISMIYNAKIANEIPDIFLFDEIDALLHPSFSKQLITFIEEYIVNKLGKQVIFVTHSPSTVAIAPEHSVYLCIRKGFIVKQIRKEEAIKNLTENLNNLTIFHENKRQIFVEDKDDEVIFNRITRKLSRHLHPEISLNFIAVSKSGTGGCSKVKEIVMALTSGGNKQVFGIIDKDELNLSKPPVFCLENRYSIENFILDPVFIAAFFIRDQIVPKDKLGIDEDFRYTDIENLDEGALQKLVNDVIKICMPLNKKNNNTLVEVQYMNGKKIQIPEWYLMVRGHNLAGFYFDKYNKIQGAVRESKKLMLYILNNIVIDIPDFIQKDFLVLLRNIQKS